MRPSRELVPMSQRDLHRYHTLRLVRERRLTGAQAAASLGLTERHIWWLLARLREKGRTALVHGNRDRPSGRRLPKPTQQQILTLARGPYAGLNTTHLTEKLQAEHGLTVSRATVHRLLRAAGGGPSPAPAAAPPSRAPAPHGPGRPPRPVGWQPPRLAGGARATLLPGRGPGRRDGGPPARRGLRPRRGYRELSAVAPNAGRDLRDPRGALHGPPRDLPA